MSQNWLKKYVLVTGSKKQNQVYNTVVATSVRSPDREEIKLTSHDLWTDQLGLIGDAVTQLHRSRIIWSNTWCQWQTGFVARKIYDKIVSIEVPTHDKVH